MVQTREGRDRSALWSRRASTQRTGHGGAHQEIDAMTSPRAYRAAHLQAPEVSLPEGERIRRMGWSRRFGVTAPRLRPLVGRLVG
jgi:hypothetical protein